MFKKDYIALRRDAKYQTVVLRTNTRTSTKTSTGTRAD